jgi:hypothetical protein
MMFQKEHFEANEFYFKNENNLDPANVVQNTVNNRVYIKILRERLLLLREKRNKSRAKPYRSYPKGTLILVRDLRPKVNKKMKAIYYKLPQKVVNEYRCTVFASDLFGRIRKHSKNNIRIMNPRAKELFEKLPTDIKIILGEELDEDQWDQIKDTGVLPAYLSDIEIEAALGRQTRGNIPEDTHLIETAPPEIPANDTMAVEDEGEGEEIQMLTSDEVVQQLNYLHSKGELKDVDISLKNVPDLYRSVVDLDPDPAVRRDVTDNQVLEVLDDDGNLVDDQDEEDAVELDPADININNILPERLRKRVRFNVPQLNSK